MTKRGGEPVTSAPPPEPAFGRVVLGRPTGYSAGANERLWKLAVRDAFRECVLPPLCRVQVEVEFVLAPDQVGRVEPDLDNLVKSTIDALGGVLGARAGTGARHEVDDVRVDRIVATKRPFQPGVQPGARIVVSERV